MSISLLKAATAEAALFELLRVANPDLPAHVNPSTVNISAPTAITPVNGLNTEITLTAKPGADGVYGSTTIRYRRLALGNVIFPQAGAHCGVRKIYGTPAGVNLSSGVDANAIAYRKKISEAMGVRWDQAGDFTVSATVTVHTATQNGVAITAHANNWFYTGAFSINLLLNNTIPIDVALPSKVLADDLTWMENAAQFYRLLSIFPSAEFQTAVDTYFGTEPIFANVTITADHQPFFDIINDLTGLNLRADQPYDAEGVLGVGGQFMAKQYTYSNTWNLKYNGVAIDSVVNSRIKGLIGERSYKVLVIDRYYTGWQKTALVIPLNLTIAE